MRADWIYKPLGEVCNVVGGGTPSKRNPAFYEGDIPWASVRDMRDEVLSRTEFKISSEAVKSSATNVIPSGNVVIATRVGLGKVCLLSQDTAINQDLRGIVPKSNNLDVRFLFRWLQSVSHVIEAEGTGATVKGVKLPFVKSLQIPVPSLPEQKRIVAILDEAFAGIATAVANTEKNLANARELFESYLSGMFSEPRDGWAKHRIEDICTLKSGTSVGKNYEKTSGDVAYIKVSDMNFAGNETEIVSSSRFLSRRDISENSIFPVGTTIFPKRGGAIATNKKRLTSIPVCADLNVMGVIPSQNLNPKFLFFYFLQIDMGKLGGGSSIPQINNYDISPLMIAFPTSVEEQGVVVSKLEEIWQEAKRLEVICQQKLNALAELKHSLLQKAFSGELTTAPQDEIETTLA